MSARAWKAAEWALARRRWLWIGAGLLVLILGVAAIAVRSGNPRDRTWERIRSEGVIRIGLDASFPPFEAMDPQTGAIAGFDVDLAAALGNELGGIQPQFLNVGFDGLYDSLLAGRFDAIISALPVDFMWTEDVHYSPAYFEAGLVLVTRRELAGQLAAQDNLAGQIGGAEDLAGHSVAIEWGSEADAVGRQLARRLSGMTLQSLPTPADALAAVAGGAADAALVDAVSAYQALHGHPDLAIVGPPLTQASYAVAMRKTSPVLARNVDLALARLKSAGTLDALLRKWL